MPPTLALFLCVCFIIWLFWLDMRERQAGSWALLIPGLWVAIIASRPVSYWFASSSGEGNIEGNPVNFYVQSSLILAALIILQRRAFAWGTFAQSNKVLVAIYVYFALSSLWSFYPVPTLKRIVKDFGSVLMALVILTEANPYHAARILFVRCSFVLFPLSVVFIKYYRDIGRKFTRGWETMVTGVATHKNGLGACAMILGIMILLDLIEIRRSPHSRMQRTAVYLCYGMLLMGSWLLLMSHSATSLVCAVIGILVLRGSKYLARMKEPRQAIGACLAGALCLAILQSAFDVSGLLLEALGRDKTLSSRTELWEMIKEQKINPVFGCGFNSFWDSPRSQAWNDVHGTAQRYEEAHNGYLETYVNGGLLGVLLLAMLLVAGGRKVLGEVLSDAPAAAAKLALLVIGLLYNWTESSFFVLGPVWFVTLLAIIESPYAFAQYGISTNQYEQCGSVGLTQCSPHSDSGS